MLLALQTEYAQAPAPGHERCRRAYIAEAPKQHAVETRVPAYLLCEITYRCGYQCQFCYVGYDYAGQDLGARGSTTILEDIKSSRCCSVVVAGAETALQ